MMEKTRDRVSWKAKWRIDKFHDKDNKIAEALQEGGKLEDFAQERFAVENIDGNIALNEGLQELIDIIIGAGTPTKWDNSNARLGVGDSNTAESASPTS